MCNIARTMIVGIQNTIFRVGVLRVLKSEEIENLRKRRNLSLLTNSLIKI